MPKIALASKDDVNKKYTKPEDGIPKTDLSSDVQSALDKVEADSTKVEKSDINGNIKINDVETKVYSHPTGSGNNHIPSGGSTGQVLKYIKDGTAAWDDESQMAGATVNNDGSAGLVPAPSAGDQNKFLRGDGTWQEAAGGSSEDCLPKTGGIVTGNVQQSGPTTDYKTYKFRNIAFGTSSTPTADAEYGGNGSIYFYYS